MKKHKNSRKVSHGKPHMDSARSVLSLLIVLIAFSLFLLFKEYQQQIFISQSFNLFIVLTTICMGLLVLLLFLINSGKAKR
ncbi:MAG: hypothetical protein A2698_00690 [Candidatus Levybacteria bacterium RIFCSPHIGHO2_01_FULL_42_15]|nr:MAG: hypothetical protein A2698_00690 [Candidatus Levybacteria bacterium RIFCSPHIGHO2_01_FULL_42_15]OGH42768.1 MAG: hypothetical protein A3B53_01485 [Candidatus Levybacteria bacterium RIFCSPLOWO2_01_FULL_42_15]